MNVKVSLQSVASKLIAKSIIPQRMELAACMQKVIIGNNNSANLTSKIIHTQTCIRYIDINKKFIYCKKLTQVEIVKT